MDVHTVGRFDFGGRDILTDRTSTVSGLEKHRTTAGTDVLASVDLHTEGIRKKKTGLSFTKSPPSVQ
jgi:hypothetical protein